MRGSAGLHINMFQQELQELEKQGLLRRLRQVQSAQGPRIVLNGKEAINLCSNNYLGLANHPVLKEAAKKAIEECGVGASASRLISGTTKLHLLLEKKIAEFKRAESALVFNSGYTANIGIISAFAGRGDVIFSDRFNHASIVDGCLLSGAEFKRYPHRNASVLQEMLVSQISKSRARQKRLIVTDTVFSMDGDIAPLPELVKLAEKYDCTLMVDEAHAAGVFGENGGGVVEHLGLEDVFRRSNFIQMGTLSKALGCFGAYVAGSKGLIDYLVNKSRAFIYTTALPASIIAPAIKALDIVQSQPQLRIKLWDNVKFFKDALEKSGVDTLQSQTQIMPILIADNEKAVTYSNQLLEKGVYIHAVRPPTVPNGQARLRITITASHTKEDLAEASDKLKEVLR